MTIQVSQIDMVRHATFRLCGRVTAYDGSSPLFVTVAGGTKKAVPLKLLGDGADFQIYVAISGVTAFEDHVDVVFHQGADALTHRVDLSALRLAFNLDQEPYAPPHHLLGRTPWPNALEEGLTTVILGVYNGGPYLKQAIESLLAQTERHIQFIFVDDASTDSSLALMQDFAARDDRIELIGKSKNAGQGAAFNTGILKARGDLVCFMDADDFWFADKVACVREVFEQDKKARKVALYQHRLNICRNTFLTTEPFRPALADGDILSMCARERIPIVGPFSPTAGLAFPTEILRAVYPIPHQFRICADGYLTRATTTLGNSKVIQEALGAYRIHDTNSTIENQSFDQQDYIHHLLLPAANRMYQQQNIPMHMPIVDRGANNVEANELVRTAYKQQQFYRGMRKKTITALDDFKDIHKGKRAFIVATGPSLKISDLDYLKDEITFSCNKITLAFDETDWRPTYYAIIDSLVYENFDFDWTQLDALKFFPSDLRPKFQSMRDSYFLHPRRPVFDENGARIFEFSDDISKDICGGYTVVYFLMQLAFTMGIETLYLIGLDFNFEVRSVSDEKTAKGEAIIVNQGEVNHFHKEYRADKQKWTMPRLDLQHQAFQKAKEQFEAAGRKIVNASRFTKLDVFEQCDFERLFDEQAMPAKTPPILDFYGAIDHGYAHLTTGEVQVKGWAWPKPVDVALLIGGQRQPVTLEMTATDQCDIYSDSAPSAWCLRGTLDGVKAGQWVRVQIFFEDGTVTALSHQLFTCKQDWQLEEFKQNHHM